MAKLIEKEKLEGKYVNLREITTDDAEFVLSLRCDPKKSRYINKTENNLQKQIDYIKRYLTLDDEWYFIIENKEHKPLGTVRIYGVEGDRFSSGSWILIDGALSEEALESEYLSKNYAFNVLGFKTCYADIRKENKKVVKYEVAMGAKIVDEDEENYYFECGAEFLDNLRKFL